MSPRAKEPICSRLKRLRDQKVLTQAELSRASGVPLPTLKDIERGATKRPRVATLRALALALGVDAAYLATGKQLS
jgi:transcriptional regulator with XRE-family HTH domain